MKNPFLTYGYAGAEYFCDRKEETQRLLALLSNGNHVALMSPRRMGKTGLLHHCFSQDEIEKKYYSFIIDIYATKSLSEFTYQFGKEVLKVLKTKERQVWESFVKIVSSLRTGITFDEMGKPSWNLEIGDITSPQTSLDEIFHYLATADKPCLIAIDEFQSIADYAETNAEAILRTYIQQCNNAHFVFSGSQQTMMGKIFNSPTRPFYQSTTTLTLKPIPLPSYAEFIKHHFTNEGKNILDSAIEKIYNTFDGTTWYIQKVCNELYISSTKGTVCTETDVTKTIQQIVNENEESYKDTMYRLTSRQKALLIAISKSDADTQITSNEFIKTNKLVSASSIQKSIISLCDKQILTNTLGRYTIYDYLFAFWLRSNY